MTSRRLPSLTLGTASIDPMAQVWHTPPGPAPARCRLVEWPDADAATTAVAHDGRMREAALTPSRSRGSDPRRESGSEPRRDQPAGPLPELFPPEVETRAPQERVRAPLRVRRSAHDKGGARTAGRRRGAASSSEVSTPAIEAEPRPAEPGLRIAAGCCDLALLAGLDVAVVWLTLRLAELDLQSLGALPLPPLVAFLCLLDGAYVAGLTAAGGQTIGKMAFGLRVTDADGGAVSLPGALARTFWTPVSLTLGLVWILFRREGRALHDVVSHTRVTAVSPRRQAPAEDGTA